MKFLKIENRIINLELVASVSVVEGAEEDGWETVVRLVAPNSAGGTVEERFTGRAARVLSQYLSDGSRCEIVGSDFGEQEEPVLQGSRPPQDVAAAPPLGIGSGKKAWFYYQDRGKQGYFLVMVNAKGSCSMRKFDAQTGRFLGKQYRPGNYQDQFAPFVADAKEVWVRSHPNLERDCSIQLPEGILAELHAQVRDQQR